MNCFEMVDAFAYNFKENFTTNYYSQQFQKILCGSKELFKIIVPNFKQRICAKFRTACNREHFFVFLFVYFNFQKLLNGKKEKGVASTSKMLQKMLWNNFKKTKKIDKLSDIPCKAFYLLIFFKYWELFQRKDQTRFQTTLQKGE